jgi:hypothetical protein
MHIHDTSLTLTAGGGSLNSSLTSLSSGDLLAHSPSGSTPDHNGRHLFRSKRPALAVSRPLLSPPCRGVCFCGPISVTQWLHGCPPFDLKVYFYSILIIRCEKRPRMLLALSIVETIKLILYLSGSFPLPRASSTARTRAEVTAPALKHKPVAIPIFSHYLSLLCSSPHRLEKLCKQERYRFDRSYLLAQTSR